ncbi:glycosyltransferase [Ferrovum sp. PN-J185]|uniref:glycosyltransferase n=1 Tax=Ferrovum sp. PN-J185 TaxID=1356306 RepID=UPI001E5EC9FA|nr:glycosyltransferase [Ferrovum sp. PN-J185]MCC6068776.1 glycosyltransferase [Ferrovum sp. PN-J185]
MKILHVYRTYFPDPVGGLQEAIRQISKSTQSYGCNNTVFTLSPSPIPQNIQIEETRVIRSKSWFSPASCDLGFIDAFKKFNRATKESDLIHYHFPWPFADILNLLIDSNKPKIITYHSDIVRQNILGYLYSPLMKHTLGCMDSIVCTSPQYLETSPILKKIENKNILKIIPLGINDRKSSLVKTSNILEKLSIQKDKFILAIGVLRYYKGFEVLIHSAKLIKKNVVIVGTGSEETRLKSLVKENNIHNVIFANYVTEEDKDFLYDNCSVFVLPSYLRSEAFGMVLVEAAMFGKPMVSCEIGTGTSYINEDKRTGFVVEPNNHERLAQAINHILDNKDIAEKMGIEARKRYEALFASDKLGQSYSNLYEQVINNHKKEIR